MICLPTAVSWPVSDWTMPILMVSWASAPLAANDAASTPAAVTTALRNMSFPPRMSFLCAKLDRALPCRQLGPAIRLRVTNSPPCRAYGAASLAAHLRGSGDAALRPREMCSAHQHGNVGPFALRLPGDRRLWQARRPILHDERMRERIPRPDDIGRRRRLVVVALVVADEMAGDAELHVGVETRIVVDVDLRDQRLEPVLGGEEMQVRGAHVVAALRAQELAHRAVDGNRVAGRLDAAEAEAAVAVGDELAAQVHVRLHRVLVLIESFRR